MKTLVLGLIAIAMFWAAIFLLYKALFFLLFGSKKNIQKIIKDNENAD